MEPSTLNTPPPAPPPIGRDAPSRNASSDMLEAGENLLQIVKKHWIGIVGLYLMTFAGVAGIVGLFLAVSPDTFNNLSNSEAMLVTLGIVLGIAVLIFFLFVATYVYRQSRVLITDRGLVQVAQSSLFIRKVTRLSFSNVEDVSADKRGILQTIFNYGTLHVQTAGPHENFEFSYCPDPTVPADIIIEAREAYAQALKEIH